LGILLRRRRAEESEPDLHSALYPHNPLSMRLTHR
jgi:hypothetical protein